MHMGDLNKFHSDCNTYTKAMNLTFVSRQYGSTAFIYFENGKAYTYGNHKEERGKGYHICKLVKNDVEQWLEQHPEFNYEKYLNTKYKEQLFSIENIEKYLNKPMIGIDINNCYFNTIYHRQYITKRTFDMGNRKREKWKLGRNASVGALAKSEFLTLYIKGIKAHRKMFLSKKDELISLKKKAIRNHVISSIYEMFLELIEGVLKGDFLMFLTDCIYVDAKYKDEVQRFFKSKGYDSKFKQFVLTKLDSERKVIVWWDYVKKKYKWYNYATHQIYGDVEKFYVVPEVKRDKNAPSLPALQTTLHQNNSLNLLLGTNIDKPVMVVNHGDLERLGGDDTHQKSVCPECKHGILVMMRDPITFKFRNFDSCTLCGQQYQYADVQDNKILSLD